MVDLTDPSTVTWTNGPLVLFHGTGADSARSMIRNVRLPTTPRAGGWDFGRGVYFHIYKPAAELWARCVRGTGKLPQVVEITIDRTQFGALRCLVFLDASITCDLSDPFWQYVNFCRSGSQIAADPYDIVMGPIVYLGGPSNREAYIQRARQGRAPPRQRRYQICFKTGDAIDLLNRSSRR